MSFIVSKPAVEVNNQAVAVKSNTVTVNEGLGETNVTAASLGGNDVEIEISDSAEDKVGKCAFEISATVKNKKSARGWKLNSGVNVVKIGGVDEEGNSFVNVYRKMSVTNDYDAALQSGGSIPLEWAGQQPIPG